MTKRRVVRLDIKDFWHADTPEAKRANPFVSMLSKRFEVRLSNDPEILIYSVHGNEHKRYECTRVFFTGENVRPNFDECDYAFSFDYSSDPRNFRLPNYHLFYGAMNSLLKPRDPRSVLDEKSGFCNFIVSRPGCRERESFYQLLSRYKRIDSPGRVFNNMGSLPNSERWFQEKVDFMRLYKFSIVFENASHPGYTTEKLLSAMAADSIGIYWGNPLVSRDFNPAAFINCHDYPDFEAVIERVKELDQDAAAYMKVIAEPRLNGNMLNPDYSVDSVLDRFEHILGKR